MIILDEIDFKIIDLLRQNSRMTWKEVGEVVHMTGQAVATRIRKLEDIGVIEGYTIKLNNEKMGKVLFAIVTVFMKSTDHGSFQRFIKDHDEITEAFRVTGEGCYSLRVNVSSQEELIQLLDKILIFGNYRVNLSMAKLK